MKRVHAVHGRGLSVEMASAWRVIEGLRMISAQGWLKLGSAFAQEVSKALGSWFAQNATAFAARFDLNEQNRWLKHQK